MAVARNELAGDMPSRDSFKEFGGHCERLENMGRSQKNGYAENVEVEGGVPVEAEGDD